MGQLIVRKIENSVKAKLQRRAKLHGRSMEEEVRDILRDAVKDEYSATEGLGTEVSRLFSKIGLDGDITELRGEKIKPAGFEP